MDFAQARHLMVESQVRTNDVTDPRILRAMRTLPRERFMPAHQRTLAYADLDLEVAPGRTLLRPRDLGKLLQLLAPKESDRALELCGATGYGAAVLAACVAEVHSLEPDSSLSFSARAALDSAGVTKVKTVSTAVETGWAEGAPYDLIFLNGAAEIVPEAWLKQLAPGGRLAVIVRDGPAGTARLYTRSQETVAYRAAFDAAPPVIPGLERPRAFTF